ncbi:UNVERIFIED_CONTAM: hypothetical protein RMT77_014048 [Armadillidium vulgare]
MDDSNGDFEMVDKISNQSDTSSTSMLTNIPPPSALPTFITAPAPPNANSSKMLPPPISVGTVIKPSEKLIPPKIPEMPITKDDHKDVTSPLPVTNQPLPPTSTSLEQPLASVSLEQKVNSKESIEVSGEGGDGWMGWIKGTVQSVGHKVAEKAKSSMDTMITTLDPQMKEFINSGGDIDIIVASDKEVKVNPIKEAFQKVFGKATVSGFASQASEIAAQPVGFEFAIQSAEERINNLRGSGKIHPQQPVVAIENFIVNFMENIWVEMGLLLLDDPWHDIILHTFTQPIPLPETFIEDLKRSTPETYNFKNSGFAKTLGQVASEHLRVHHTMWQESLTGVTRREYILMAARSLAELYRTRLPTDVI